MPDSIPSLTENTNLHNLVKSSGCFAINSANLAGEGKIQAEGCFFALFLWRKQHFQLAVVIALQVIILSHLFRFFQPLASGRFIAFFQITQPHQKIESIFIFLFPHRILEMPDRGVIVLGKESFACQSVPVIRIAHTVGIHA